MSSRKTPMQDDDPYRGNTPSATVYQQQGSQRQVYTTSASSSLMRHDYSNANAGHQQFQQSHQQFQQQSQRQEQPAYAKMISSMDDSQKAISELTKAEEAEALGKISVHGWMHKQGTRKFKGPVAKSWRKRYFALENNTIYYFHDPVDARKYFNSRNADLVIGAIDLRDAFKLEQSERLDLPARGIAIHTRHRVWLLCPETESGLHDVVRRARAHDHADRQRQRREARAAQRARVRDEGSYELPYLVHHLRDHGAHRARGHCALVPDRH
ncbi:hypothetical protein PINS_up006950 [Pythium insidiosum]|nr:hypothetical protein PINS_up006950 [Pythium insidiosum]